MTISPSLLLTSLLTLILFSSCGDTHDISQFVGDWKGTSWELTTQGDTRDASQVTFSFTGDHTYEASYGAQSEKGTFRVQLDKLYTTETGKAEKNVSYTFVGTDTLQLEMNRMGDLEVLTLVKQQ
jgi:hypothetical protein